MIFQLLQYLITTVVLDPNTIKDNLRCPIFLVELFRGIAFLLLAEKSILFVLATIHSKCTDILLIFYLNCPNFFGYQFLYSKIMFAIVFIKKDLPVYI